MARDWRLAKSLDVLRDEIETEYPGTTVWTIGDQNHQNGYSDHNPNGANVVCAIDVKGDGGLNLATFVLMLLTDIHPNLRYVIYRRKIYERSNDFEARHYGGANPHDEHVHVSVGNGPDGRSTRDYDNTRGWGIAEFDHPSNPSKPSKPSTGNDRLGDNMPTLKRGSKGIDVRRLQALMVANGYKVSIDGKFGPQTEKILKSYQSKYANPADGIAGPITWNALLGVK
jgi:putative peptidoglycan binding protein